MRAALGILLLAALPAWAEMYKCVDERGVTHYTDKPRPGCKGGQVEIRGSPSISGQGIGAQQPRDVAAQEADFKRRQIQREETEAKEQAASAQRCAKLRNEYNLLASSTRLFRFDDKGQRVYVEDASREARTAQLKEQLRTCP
ncbi:MAG TPA: DUF4124 domain-containing protein [Burkholderiales bacterium]|nr:DUF4124 domain-containing protein [Burkholderiales bacterium]